MLPSHPRVRSDAASSLNVRISLTCSSLEPLEERRLMAAEFRSFDGSGNNLLHPDWGSAGIQLIRRAAAEYADGVSAPAGEDRPSPRAISNAINAVPEPPPGADEDDFGDDNERDLSPFVYVWGQFIDHDLDLTPAAGGADAEAFDVPVPRGDRFFDPTGSGDAVIRLNRSQSDPDTGTSAGNPRQQINTLTAWLDGSVIYGTSADRAAALRTFFGGRMKTSDRGLLPFNTKGLPNANDAHLFDDEQLFLGGDVRANENVELTAMHSLFVREHNRVAREIAADDPSLNDEAIFQQARAVVSAELQAITFNEFLPALLGDGAIAPYDGYDPAVNPAVATEFSTAAYRLGHSMLNNEVEFISDDGEETRDPLPLAQAFFNPTVLPITGLAPIMKYLASDRAQEIDVHVVDGVRNFLFGPPGAGGFDLASLNIQRGRDHGLADYNDTRAAYGLPRVTSFDQITSDDEIADALREVYGSVDDIDLWVGCLAEDHADGSSVGPLVSAIVSDQFERVRDGDRFWYENQFTGEQLDDLRALRLCDVIQRNTQIDNIQSDVFRFDVSIRGRAYSDHDADGRRDGDDRGLSGWRVQLLDGEGDVVAVETTSSSGRYQFDGLELGTYEVRVVKKSGWTITTDDNGEIEITRGGAVSGVDIGYAEPAD
jgi:hypothetical protein